MENSKSFSVKKREQIYLFLGWLGVAIVAVGIFLDGPLKAILPWVGLGSIALAVVYRQTMVRCPYCGNHLSESKSIPDKCPECHKELT